MTLSEVKAAWLKDQSKRIIREPNNGCHYISVWFTVSTGLLDGCLMVNGWQFHPDGMIHTVKRAAFQESEHTDWILIN